MANKYEKIDFGTGQNTNTGDTIYDGFDKVNKAFDEIENDIESLDTKVDGEVTIINNRIDDVVSDVNDVINTEIATINNTITELSNDVNEIINTEITNINNRIDDVVSDVNNVIDNEIATINTTITELNNDLDQLSDKIEDDLLNYYTKPQTDTLIANVGIFPNQQTRIGQGANTTHQWSSAFGFGAKANNQLSSVFGGGSEAYRNSVTVGCMNFALTDSVVIGNELGASVDNVILVGVGLLPQHRGEIILGRFNKIADNQVNVLNPTNHLFTIANGSSVANRSNAFVVFNNGKVELSNVSNYNSDYSASFTEHSLVDKKYVDDNVASTVNTAISTILDGAPETFDTLKEIADWIENDGVDAGELAESIALKVDKSEFNTFKTANTAHINGVYDGLNSRINSLQSTVSANQTEMFGITGGLTGELATLKNTVNGHTAQITNNYNGLDSRLTILNSTVSNNYSYLSGQIGPIGGRLNTIESNYTSLTNHINTFYSKGEIDGMLMGLESRVNNKITVDISTQLNTNVYPRLTTVENKFAGYYTIQQTNTLLENAGVFSKNQSTNAIFYKTADMANFRTLGQNSLTIVNEWFGTEPVGAGGANSVAIGYNATAKSDNSIAFGYNAVTFGDNSIAFGTNAKSNASQAVAIGTNAKAMANNSIAFGQTNSSYTYCLTIGRYNTTTATPEQGWTAGSPIFQIGNGTSDSVKRDAYVMRNDGSSTQAGIAFYQSDMSANYTVRSLVDKGYTDTNFYTKTEMTSQLNARAFGAIYSVRKTNSSSVGFPTPTQSLLHTYNYAGTGFINAGGLNEIEGACWFGFNGNLQNFENIKVEVHLMASEGHSLPLGEVNINCEALSANPSANPSVKHKFEYSYIMGAGGNAGTAEVNYVKNEIIYNAGGTFTQTKTPTTISSAIYQTFNASSLQLRFYGIGKSGTSWADLKLASLLAGRHWLMFK